MKKEFSKVFAASCLIIGCLVGQAVSSYAEDLTKFFVIASPQYIERIFYIRKEPRFRIKAPEGWYMAKASDDYPSVERVFFCKSDPTTPLSEGRCEPFDFAYIKAAFLANPEQLPPGSMIDNAMAQVKATGTPIMLQEEITVAKKTGGHFTSAVPGTDLIMDTYIFTSEDAFIVIKAICKKDLFEKIKPEIKEAIGSIKFK